MAKSADELSTAAVATNALGVDLLRAVGGPVPMPFQAGEIPARLEAARGAG